MEETILLIAELIGTAAFAITGVSAAVEKNLDIFGALVLGCITACGGGMIRDILIGALPPALFTRPLYIAVAAAVSLLTFLIFYFKSAAIERSRERINAVVNVFDAVGLAVFGIVGVRIAASAGVGENGFLVVCVGVLTAVGGGILRDTLCGKIPGVLRKRIYAVAAMIGVLLAYFLPRLGLADWAAMLIAAAAVIAMRVLASHYKWSLPRVYRENK